jgi:hypothetical protein
MVLSLNDSELVYRVSQLPFGLLQVTAQLVSFPSAVACM